MADADTRRLTRILRDKGAQSGCLMAGEAIDEERALAEARGFAGLKGMDLAKEVSVDKPYTWDEGSWVFGIGHSRRPAAELPWHVVAYDYGVKRNILRMLVDRGCRLTVVPAQTPAGKVLALRPDGVFLSNGPGDPETCTYAIEAIGAAAPPDAASQFKVFLLFGVPGSGKTEVYVRAIRSQIAQGRQAIVLVPEIAMATQAVDRLARQHAGFRAGGHQAMASVRHKDEAVSDVAYFVTCLGRVWATGATLDWAPMGAGELPPRLELPPYAWDHNSYFIDTAPPARV